MKHVIALIILFVNASCFCQDVAFKRDSALVYTGIVTVDSIPAKELSLRARQWFGNTFKSTKDVLQVNDIENGELSGDGSFLYTATLQAYGAKQMTTGYIGVKISIWVKEGRYKYEIGPFSVVSMTGVSDYIPFAITSANEHPSTVSGKMSNKNKDGLNAWWNEIKKECQKNGLELAQELKLAMKQPYKGNW